MPMRALDRPALCAQLLLLSAGAGAFCVPPLSHRIVRCLATERQALVMNAGGGSPIPELAALYEATQGLTFPGWEQDIKREESLWALGRTTAASIKRMVERMRRKQRLHDSRTGDRVIEKSPTMTQIESTSPTMTMMLIPAPAVCFLLTWLWFIIDAAP